MADPIELPLDDDDRLCGPPLLDLFREESDRYVATFVPSDDVSPEPTLTVNIAKQSVEGRVIDILLARVAMICGARLGLASHLGGGNFTLRLLNDQVVTLDALDSSAAMEIFDRLKQIADAAEMSYRLGRTATRRWRTAI